MCGPMAAVAIGMMAVAAVSGAASTYMQGKAEHDAARYQEKVAKQNRDLSNQAAEDALKRGALAESEQRAKGRMILGAQRAAGAANGIDVASDTLAEITSSQAGLNELDALSVRSNASRESWNYKTQAMNYQANADMLHNQAQSAAFFSKVGAVTTLATGVSQVAGQWYQYKSAAPAGGAPSASSTYGDAGTATQRSGFSTGGGSGSYDMYQRSNYSSF